jgi:hypothetical protein
VVVVVAVAVAVVVVVVVAAVVVVGWASDAAIPSFLTLLASIKVPRMCPGWFLCYRP